MPTNQSKNPIKLKTYDVVIIGAGITGISSAFHLQQKLSGSFLLIAPDTPEKTTTLRAAGFITGGMIDNFTRISHAYGGGIGKEVWEFCNRAYDSVIGYAESQKINHLRGPRLRLITTQHEFDECVTAARSLEGLGFGGSISSAKESNWAHDLLGIQKEDRGGWIDPDAFYQNISEKITIPKVNDHVLKLTNHGSFVELALGNGENIGAEMVIVGCHLETASLIPGLKTVLIPYADEWHTFRLREKTPIECSSFTTLHGNIWGTFQTRDTVAIGGARFLRAMEGVDANKAEFNPKVKAYLGSQIEKLFGVSIEQESLQGRCSIDCRPCDELPVIGPMFGWERVLVGTGYMGQGLTLGFFTGKMLAELVANGNADGLPRILQPRRLRSISN